MSSGAAKIPLGPFHIATRLLPHWEPNAGIRVTTGGQSLVYTGDCGPSRDLVTLAREADLLLAEASYVDDVPADSRDNLSSASLAARQASAAGVARLLLTHLLPGTPPPSSRAAAAGYFLGDVGVATAGLVVDLSAVS